MITTDDISPDIIASIRASNERVIVKTDHGYRLGIRGHSTYGMFNCLGRLTITEDNEVYHSMATSRPTYTLDEFNAYITTLHGQIGDANDVLQRYHAS